MTTLPQVQGAWFFFYRKGNASTGNPCPIRYNPIRKQTPFYISMGHMLNRPLPGWLLGMENALRFAFTQFLLLFPAGCENACGRQWGCHDRFRLTCVDFLSCV